MCRGLPIKRNKKLATKHNEAHIKALEDKLTARQITSMDFINCAKHQMDRVYEEAENHEEQNYSDDEGDEPIILVNPCPICTIVENNAVINPCGHTMCKTCGDNLMLLGRHCHMCRGPITSIIQTFN
jgi:hypothetical protein